MVHNVRSVEALLADGSKIHFGPSNGRMPTPAIPDHLLKELWIWASARPGKLAIDSPIYCEEWGYNIDALIQKQPNFGHLLVGSEGTLGFFQRIHLDLNLCRLIRFSVSPLPEFLFGYGLHAAHREAQSALLNWLTAR